MATTPHTRHITRMFRAADADTLAAGLDWYPNAHSIAAALADSVGVSTETSAGVIAALSPMMGWGSNITLAARLMRAGGLTRGALRANLDKANRIFAGAAPLDVLGGDKVRNFYLSIATAGERGVCIDRHAWSLAHNDRSLTQRVAPTTRQYERVAGLYERAARILSSERGEHLSAATVQAVTWVAWRRRWWSVGAFEDFTLEP